MSDQTVGATARRDHGLTLATGQVDAGRGQLQGERRTRRARLRISRLDPWSVMKTAFLSSIAFGIMTWIAVYVVWTVIGASGLQRLRRTGSTRGRRLGSGAWREG